MELLSSAFRNDTSVPRRYTCDGKDISPPLYWRDLPKEARSLALVCDDPDAERIWHHWAVYDIPVKATELPEDIHLSGPVSYPQGINDFHRPGYGGPCPPHGDGPHRYRFSLFALDVDRLPLPSDPSCVEIERTARAHAIAEAKLTGLYAR